MPLLNSALHEEDGLASSCTSPRESEQTRPMCMDEQAMALREDEQTTARILSSGGSGVNVSSAPRDVKRRVCWWSGHVGKD